MTEPVVDAECIDDQPIEAVQAADMQPQRQVWSPVIVRSRLQLHWTFLIMAFIIILLSFLMRSEGPTAVYLPGTSFPLPESCASKRLFGWDCPGCGMTRAFISISHGQMSRAWNFNAASFILYPFIAIQIPWNLLQIWMLVKRRRAVELPYIHFAPIAIFVFLILNWCWQTFL